MRTHKYVNYARMFENETHFIFFLKTSNGQVEAKVQCFYRKRDLSSTLALQAERHLCKYQFFKALVCILSKKVACKVPLHFATFSIYRWQKVVV